MAAAPVVIFIQQTFPRLAPLARGLWAALVGAGSAIVAERLVTEALEDGGDPIPVKQERFLKLLRFHVDSPPFATQLTSQGISQGDARSAITLSMEDIPRAAALAPATPPRPPAIPRGGPFASVNELSAERARLDQALQAGALDRSAYDGWLATVYNPALAALIGPAPAVVAPAPPAIPGEVLEGSAAGLASLGAIATLTTVLSQAMSSVANNIRDQHLTRQTCVTSTAQTILGALGSVAGPLALPLVLFTSERGRELVDQVIGTVWDSIFNEDVVPRPASPDRALETARTLFAEKAALAAASHVLAVSAESNANLKHMGIGYLAAFLADLAGWQRLANLTMGEVEFAALGLPMRQRVMRDYRPQLPTVGDLATAYAKKEVPPGPIPQGYPPRAGFTEPVEGAPTINLYEALSRQGLPDEWIRVYSHHLFLDPRLSELVRIGQFYNPQLDPRSAGATEFMTAWINARPWLLEQIGISREEWDSHPWAYFKTSVAGYEPADVRVIVETMLRAVVRREQTLALDATTRLFRDGFIGPERLRELVEEVWGVRPGPDGAFTFRGDPILARIRATELRTLHEDLADRQELALRALSHGLLAEEEAVATLTDLGMPAERVHLAVIREKMGLVPRTRLAVVAQTLATGPGAGDQAEGE